MTRHIPTKTTLFVAALASAAPALAAVDTYKVDPDHTYPSIEFSHMGLSVWRGKFNRTEGTITLDRAARTGTVDIVVDVNSIDFGLDSMHKEARSENFFDVARYPKATYKGTVKFAGDKPSSVDGHVTIMGVTRPVPLKINLFNCMPHPMLKKEVCGADAEGEVNWSQFGMKMSKYGAGDAGRVRLRIQVEALRQDPASE
jgi:polyisoprenoid-binding protein YceI